MNRSIPVSKGMLCHLIGQVQPAMAQKIAREEVIKTAVMGLGRQATRHIEMMRAFGTTVSAGIAPNRGGGRICENIPTYNTLKECLKVHPNISAVSIWRHFSTAKDAVLSAISAEIPLVVIITEGLPQRDMRAILSGARHGKTLIFGSNTPGIIFPPEAVKIGMLPHIFYPQEISPGQFGPEGVTILSRSGAILYHISDGLSSVGIAQNAVLGVGGDGIIGSTFRQLVPLVSTFDPTDLIVIAGEIGGCQEELLAEDMGKHPEKYPKPVVAFLSGAKAPAGKTMGHAGAISAPGEAYGTFEVKKKALEEAGVSVANSQRDLIELVRKKLKSKTYFQVDRYYQQMKKQWSAPPKQARWTTRITQIKTNSILLSGYPIEEVIEKSSLIQGTAILITGELVSPKREDELFSLARKAAQRTADTPKTKNLSKYISTSLLLDSLNQRDPLTQTVFTLGRCLAYFRSFFKGSLPQDSQSPLSHFLFSALTGREQVDPSSAKMLEAMALASLDHGVTPPSAQATILSASVRPPYEVALASGVGAITHVHGGAGEKAVHFFRACEQRGKPWREAVRFVISQYLKEGKTIEGMGHRIHTQDPRRDVLWKLARELAVERSCVEISREVPKVFKSLRGMDLPLNVDGVIGAVVADLSLAPPVAKALFILGRLVGLSAHYYEEITTQPAMRRINFSQALYQGKEKREL